MGKDTMLIVLLIGGAALFYAHSQGMLGNLGGGAPEPEPEPEPAPCAAGQTSTAEKPCTPATPAPTGGVTGATPLPGQIGGLTTTTNIYNIQRPPIYVRQGASTPLGRYYASRPAPIPIIYNVTPYNRAVIIRQLNPQSIDIAYTRVAQYIVYFKTGRKGPVDWRWLSFAKDKSRMAVGKAGFSPFHGRFADKFLEVAYKIQYAPTSRDVEIWARDAANIFISLEQTDPTLLISVR